MVLSLSMTSCRALIKRDRERDWHTLSACREPLYVVVTLWVQLGGYVRGSRGGKVTMVSS
jgi:hypothetical protein